MHSGSSSTAIGDFDYSGNAKNAIGGILRMPAGRSDTLRFSYFRVTGTADKTLSQAETLFGEAYSAGDYLTGSNKIQSAKISWDYLSYNWYRPSGTLRLKTLYEAQFVTISNTFVAPFKPITTDSSGNTDTGVASGSKNLFYPTLGMELEQAIGPHFRWEVKGSGFGIPHRGNIWDAEASLAFRVGSLELLAGEKAYHFQTSPHLDHYFADTLSGAYVGVRYYWGRER
jgi:hypothetical protein